MLTLASRPLGDLASTLTSPLMIPSHFLSWTVGETPFSTHKSIISLLLLYLVTVLGGAQLMVDRKPLKCKSLFMLHNALLSVGSAILFVLILEEIIPIVLEHGFFYGICNAGTWTPRLETLYVINFYFKIWELLDTCFLVVKKKDLQFLHVYHHAATLFAPYTQLNGLPVASWVSISFNLLVHVVMYYYYFASARGDKIWWKKYLTTMQITQFVTVLTVYYFGSYTHFAEKYGGGNWPYYGEGGCAGSDFSIAFGTALLTSYLLLFINFYSKTYKVKSLSTKKVQ